MDALINLALMTGSLGEKGRGLYLLGTENNQIGAWDMGTVPDFLPGRQSISNDGYRKHWEQAWRVKLSPDPGLNIIRMIEEAEKGNLKALYIMGENPIRSLPESERVRKAFRNLEFLVVQDILSTETTELAHVVLPGAAFSEKGGSFTNLEGRIQSFEPVVHPPGQAKPDWEILDLLGRRMGHPESYPSVQRVRAEIRRRIPMYAGLGDNGAPSWVRGKSDLALFHSKADGEPILFTRVIPTDDEDGDQTYAFTAVLGSLRFHMGSGTRTGLSDRLRAFGLKGEVEVSMEDGKKLDLKQGDEIRISSPYGAILREVTLNRDLRPGLIFIPLAFHNNDARQLIGLTPLGLVDSPGWKTVHVKIERLET